MNFSSYEGGSWHGHLGLIMTNDEYFTLAMDVFTALENPGATPEIVNNATAAQITEANRARKEATFVHRTYNNINQAFKKLIIDVFDDQFLNALSSEVVWYANNMT
jgi:23S rRNA G2069 N7-methylase RlmK/C1962 C5-methylase RlmI